VVGYTASTFGLTGFDSIPLQDPIITITNGHYLPAVQMFFYGGFFGGAALQRVVMDTPRSRQVVPPTLWPINANSLPPDRPHIVDRRQNPFILSAVEEVKILMSVGGTAASPNTAVMIWGTSIDPVPMGDIYSLHGVSTTAAVAGQWAQLSVIWDQNLPAGTYVVVGSQHQSTNAIAHRMIFKDQVWRPGFLSVQTLTQLTEHGYYYGGWGRLGSFNTYTMPQIEVWCQSADVAHDITLNFVRTA
jgi:hypothetical protein